MEKENLNKFLPAQKELAKKLNIDAVKFKKLNLTKEEKCSWIMYCFYSIIAGKEFEFGELINGLEDGSLMDHRVFTEEGVKLLLDVVRAASTLEYSVLDGLVSELKDAGCGLHKYEDSGYSFGVLLFVFLEAAGDAEYSEQEVCLHDFYEEGLSSMQLSKNLLNRVLYFSFENNPISFDENVLVHGLFFHAEKNVENNFYSYLPVLVHSLKNEENQLLYTAIVSEEENESFSLFSIMLACKSIKASF